MIQITEDYCSFEIANLLKEKGFNEPCVATYNLITKDFEIEDAYQDWTTRWAAYVSVPTHQMVLKWLREVYKIFIEINVSIDLNGDYHYNYSILDKECKYIKRFVGYYSNYESCVEAALLYVLKNLI